MKRTSFEKKRLPQMMRRPSLMLLLELRQFEILHWMIHPHRSNLTY
jgi:hypothetical protein